MSESSPSLKGSEAATPDGDGDVEMKTAIANGASSDSDAAFGASKKRKTPDGSEDEDMADGGDELFGSDDDADGPAIRSDGDDMPSPTKKRRLLDDEELDSGDDESRDDRAADEGEEPRARYHVDVAAASLGRHKVPKGTDGEVYLLKLPQFLGIKPEAFTLGSFVPPTKNHHSHEASEEFSPSQVSNSTIRWRRSPKDHNVLQSNSRIIRWSDGSLTLQLGSSPLDQHELPAMSLAPPQARPTKPTPVSRVTTQAPPPYDSKRDAHTYLVSTHPGPSLSQVTNHVTAALSVQTTTSLEEDDAAVKQLQAAMAQHKGAGAAAAGGGGDGRRGPDVITVYEDPEQAKRDAERVEKERVRRERREEQARRRQTARSEHVLGRAGLGRRGALDDDDELGAGVGGPRRPRKPAGARRRAPRRRDSYTDEDEDGGGYGPGRGRTREDEYDEDDGFLVGSDEEPEVVEDDEDEDEDEEIIDNDRGGQAAAAAPAEDGGARDAGPPPSRSKRRKVVEDDEDED